MTKVEFSRRNEQLREEYRQLYRTMSEDKTYGKRTAFVSYIKLGIFMLEMPLVMYYLQKDKRKYRRERAQTRATATKPN